MNTIKIFMPKVTQLEDVEKKCMENVLTESIVTVPKNIIDVEYFRNALQFHIFNLSVSDANVKLYQANEKIAKLKKEGNEWTKAYTNAEKNRNDTLILLRLLNDAILKQDTELKEDYEDIKEVKYVFLSDMFAKLYAWSILGAKSYKVLRNDKIEEINLHIANESNVVTWLKYFDDAESNNESKKIAVEQLQQFANDTFSTNGGELYKNITFKLSVNKVNTHLYARFKEPLKHDGKGNLKDVERQAFIMAIQLFNVCLIQLGVPTINGQKIVKVDEVENCKEVLTVKRKKKENKKENKKEK